jgi:hypothetical protein
MYRLTILSIWRSPLITLLDDSPWQIPLITPLVPESLSLTWNPSFLCGVILVHPGPRLLVNWPPPPHSLFPPPTVPQSNYAPFYDDITTPTSLSSAHLHYIHCGVYCISVYCNHTICTVCMYTRKDNYEHTSAAESEKAHTAREATRLHTVLDPCSI